MATLGEVEAALGVLAFGYLGDAAHPPGPAAFAAAFAAEAGQAALRARVTLLHCTTEYPAPVEDTNLRAMDTLRRAFDLPVGYSDHTDGIAIAVAAAARGATCIEKHFTLARDLPGPDHRASIEPGTLAAMVRSVRAVESAMGDGVKRPRPSELANRMVARKSLVAARALARGEIFSADNVAAKRPGGGLAPMLWWAVLGRAAARDYAADEPLDGGEAGGVA
jgi:N-acetylneuraminate synthase